MSNVIQKSSDLTWRTLKDLMQAAKGVSDIYVRAEILGGHYIRVTREDFLEAARGMRAAAPAHPHPIHFKYTVDSGILWIHTSLEHKTVRLAKAEAKRAAVLQSPPAPTPPPAGYLRSHRTTGALQFSIVALTVSEMDDGWIERPFWTAPPS